MACLARCLPVAVLFILLLQACTTRPAVDPATASAAQSAHAVIVAESAWRDHDRFHIRYRTDGDVAYSTGVIRPSDNGAEILTAGQQGEIPTEVSLEALPVTAWPADPAGAWTPLTVLSARHWESVFRLLRERLTPAEPHTGAVIDILQLQEWFSWYDEADTLHWALIEDKPADVRVKYSYRFEHVLTVLGRVLADYLPVAGITARQLLLNTGATGPDRTPFVYADLDSGRVLFLTSRAADGRKGDGKSGAAHVRATTHLIIGQMRSLVSRPVSRPAVCTQRPGRAGYGAPHRAVAAAGS